MPELKDHVAHLSQEIGARPAGTEEEQQAALYIREQLEKSAGLKTSLEDFQESGDSDLPAMICCGASIVLAVLALIVPVLGVAAIVVTLIAAVLFAAEAFDKPVLSRVLRKGVSQNVVAKYEPGISPENGTSRRRKVIVVARYDTGKVRAELANPVVAALPALQWASLGALIALPILLLIKTVAFAGATGAPVTVLTVLIVIALVLAAIPLVVGILHMTAAYNEGANNNATGVAALLELAQRVGTGRIDDGVPARGVTVHGEDAARAAGAAPEGAELVYDVDPSSPDAAEEESAEYNLTAAKAAVAALTGKPVDGMSASDIEDQLVQIERHDRAARRAAAAAAAESRAHDDDSFMIIPPEAVQAAAAQEPAAQRDVQPDDASSAGVRAQVASGVSGGSAAGARVQDQGKDAASVSAPAAGVAVAGAAAVVAAGAAGAASASEAAPAASPDSAALSAPAPSVSSDAVPDWFRKAQEKAKKSRTIEKPVQRSRYASALDAAVAESAGHFAEANRAADQVAHQALEADRSEIHEVKAPQWAVAAAQKAAANKLAANERAQADAQLADAAGSAAGAFAAGVGGSNADSPANLDGAPAASSEHGWLEQDSAAVFHVKQSDSYAQMAPDASWNAAAYAEDAAGQNVHGSGAASTGGRPVPDRKPVGAPAASALEDPFATTAIDPIDMSTFNLNDVPSMKDLPMPSFLDPRKVQEQARAQHPEGNRSGNRVDVTQAQIGASGRIEQLPETVQPAGAPGAGANEAPAVAAPVPAPAPFIAPLENAASPTAQASAAPSASHQPITLPAIGVSAANPAPVAPPAKQRAPLADVESAGKTAAKSLLNMLPSIGQSDVAAEERTTGEDDASAASASESKKSLRSMLPSLSGAIKRSDSSAAPANVSSAGSFAAAGATGSFAPVGDELLDDVDPDDMYVEDADDSAYGESFTETGAFAGPDYVEMPKSRFRRLLDRFHHKEEKDEGTPQQWLDVDDQFEARAAGAARGGWESFREDDVEADRTTAFEPEAAASDALDRTVDFPAYQDANAYADQAGEAWNAQDGGAYGDDIVYEESAAYNQYDDQADYSYAAQDAPYDAENASGGYAPIVNGNASQNASYDDVYADDFDVDDIDDGASEFGADTTPDGAHAKPGKHAHRFWHGGAFSTDRLDLAEQQDDAADGHVEGDALAGLDDVEDGINQVYEFRAAGISTEIWFVALGSELANNSGMRAFLAEHQQDLRGAFVIEIDALGAGKLSMIEREGVYKASKSSSRMKRSVRKASQATGVSVGTGSLLWQNSAASVAAKHGLQATHLVGMDGLKPALYGEQNDVMESIDMKTLQANVGFLMELLKNI